MKKILCFVIMILLFGVISGCNTNDTKEERVRFDYSMSALTVAADRAYAKVTGGVSTVMLSEKYLSDLPEKLEVSEDYPLWPYKGSMSFITAVTINYIYEFEIESPSTGNQPNVIGDYCGGEPYKVKIVWYCYDVLRVIFNEQAQNVIEIYYSTTAVNEYNQFMIIEGSSGGPLFYKICGGLYPDDPEHTDLKYCEFYYRLGLEDTSIKLDNTPNFESSYNEEPYIVFRKHYDDNSLEFFVTNIPDYPVAKDDYIVNYDSVKLYELNQKYTIFELLVPEWYAEETREENLS